MTRFKIRGAMPINNGLVFCDPDAHALLEVCRFEHGENAFELLDSARRLVPPGDWSRSRYAAARSRLISGGYLTVVRS